MSSTSVQIAEGVKDEITAAIVAKPLSQTEFTLERSYADWELELEGASNLRVDVVAVATEIKTQLSARGKLRYLVPIDIAVRQRFGADKQDEDTGRLPNSLLDPLVLFVEEIHEAMTSVTLSGFDQAVWQETNTLVNPVREHLRQWRQFTGVVRVTFRHDKAT